MSSRYEKERLSALESYEIMDTSADETLDSITNLAAYICGTPVSLITLLDDKRQWFKSNNGLDTTETTREVAFCDYAIQQDEFFVVENAELDPRFKNNPLVTSDPYIRFYLGYPLINEEGYALGTLCVIDRKPRKLNNNQRQSIKALSKLAMAYLEMQRQRKHIKETRKMKQDLLDEVSYNLRTPLNVIYGLTTILLEKNELSEFNEDLYLLNESAENTIEVVNKLAEVNRPGLGLPNKHLIFNLHSLIETLIGEISDEYNVDIKYTYDFGIPGFLVGDPDRIQQMLRHLICAQLAGRETSRLHLSVESLRKSKSSIRVKLDLIDTSADPLLQDTRSLVSQRQEVNSAIEIIKTLKGGFSKQPGYKSVTLDFDIQNATVESQPNKGDLYTEDISGIKLLLVEDMEINQRIAAKFFKMWDVRFDIVNNGKEAIDTLKKKNYDIVLMDMRMPVMNGFEAIRKIRAMKNKRIKTLPIIALTASVFDFTEAKLKNIGLTDLVNKPFNPNELKQKIAKALQIKKF
ncbi:response regulator [Fulvivirga ulvae]|uniref:response regulator n=1 Tax=Fulvivirga ulvae TaxID=2904245 RepID=UPI001F166D94|nr:response regulator [Fulvivirga ulvae]UII30117.1 response regulator [Fulvivirga ulvae]